jgi:hypothetical protein
MAVTYDDVEEKRLGRQAKIAQLADAKIENDLAEQEMELSKAEQDNETALDEALTQDAMDIIKEMDNIQAQGGDPMAIYNQLPVVIQGRVSELLSGAYKEEQDNQKLMEITPLNAQQPAQQQAIPQQQPANITEQAKQIAAL